MSTSFANLMALSATQTKEQQSAVEVAIRERQRKEVLKKQQQEERDAKERELEKQRRLKIFEDQKREEQRLKRQEEAKKAQEAAFRRREEEQKLKLLYGPRKAAKMASSSSSGDPKAKASGARIRSPGDNDDGGPIPLTREELRERKMKMERDRMYGLGSAKKSSSSFFTGSIHRAGRKLPGGAVDVTTASTSASQASPGERRSVKDRLTAMPNTLVKLNPVKRDTRTIDEILQDRAKAKEGKVLEGDQALVFDDWFGSKKKDTKPATSRPSSTAPSSGADTPSHSASPSFATPAQKKSGHASKTNPSYKSMPIPKSSLSGSSSQPRGSAPFRNPTHVRVSDKAKSAVPPKSRKSDHYSSSHLSGKNPSSSALSKKRNRSDSRSESPPPKRRNRSHEEDEMDVSTEIWKMFGKNRDAYVNRDVMSDEEDMEADSRALEEEELRSARIAQREEQMALEQERRHEDEKRKKRKMLARG